MNRFFVVQRSGELELFDPQRLLIKINGSLNPEQAIKVVDQIEKEISTRFQEFYPNADNIKDLLEKHLLLVEKGKTPINLV
jgi:hypothetical protein|tara:strand:- start:442 stop:684 length:243 start_codon:yes stop_codon:yes gene_type:complete